MRAWRGHTLDDTKPGWVANASEGRIRIQNDINTLDNWTDIKHEF